MADHVVRQVLRLGGFGLVSCAVPRQSADLCGPRLAVRPRQAPFVRGLGEPPQVEATSVGKTEFNLGDFVGAGVRDGVGCGCGESDFGDRGMQLVHSVQFPACELRDGPRGEPGGVAGGAQELARKAPRIAAPDDVVWAYDARSHYQFEVRADNLTVVRWMQRLRRIQHAELPGLQEHVLDVAESLVWGCVQGCSGRSS